MGLLFRLVLVVGLSAMSVLTTQLNVSAQATVSHHIDASMSCSVPCQTNVPRKDEQASDTIESEDDTPDIGTDTSTGKIQYQTNLHEAHIRRHVVDRNISPVAHRAYTNTVKIHILHSLFRI